MPLSYRQLQARISKYNEFNRRTFDETSPSKKSLFFKYLKKSTWSLMNYDFQNEVQHAVTKKKIASKEEAMRDSQIFWETIKEKL